MRKRFTLPPKKHFILKAVCQIYESRVSSRSCPPLHARHSYGVNTSIHFQGQISNKNAKILNRYATNAFKILYLTGLPVKTTAERMKQNNLIFRQLVRLPTLYRRSKKHVTAKRRRMSEYGIKPLAFGTFEVRFFSKSVLA